MIRQRWQLLEEEKMVEKEVWWGWQEIRKCKKKKKKTKGKSGKEKPLK